VFWSCRSTANTADTGAQVAGALGVLDPETAKAANRSGSAGNLVAEEITPEHEYYLGRAVGAGILSRYGGIWQGDAGLTNYLNEICAAIAINSPRPELYSGYHVALLDSMELNAFSTSGGHIFITRGMAACADSEDALAAVIAHEIGHIQLRHSIKVIKATRRARAAVEILASAAKTLANDTLKELAEVMDESAGEIITTLIDTGYSQEQEYDADTAAMILMAAAGYDPSSLLSMLRQVEQNQGGGTAGLAKTHPSPAQRIVQAQETAHRFKLPDTRSYRAARYDQIKN
jgi:predicted Zn-dependent protease